MEDALQTLVHLRMKGLVKCVCGLTAHVQEVVVVLFPGTCHLVPCKEAQNYHCGYGNDGLEDAKAAKGLLPKRAAFDTRHTGGVVRMCELLASSECSVRRKLLSARVLRKMERNLGVTCTLGNLIAQSGVKAVAWRVKHQVG